MTLVQKTTEDWEADIGEQVRALRIRHELSQAQLASASNISLGAVKKLENGQGSSLKTLIHVVRALHADAWLEQLSPKSIVSPMQVLRDQQLNAPRRRVYKKREKRVAHV